MLTLNKKLEPVIEMLEGILTEEMLVNKSNVDFILLIMKNDTKDCDYIASVNPQDALLLIAKWLQVMMRKSLVSDEGPVGHG